jgi:hypothetical protein
MRAFRAPPFAVLLLAIACNSDPAAPAPTGLGVTFSVYSKDGLGVPIIVADPDSGCQGINTGGWVTLESNRQYSMTLDRIGRFCAGQGAGSSLVIGNGRYRMRGDSVLFRPDPGYGPEFTGRYYAGNWTPEAGGNLPGLSFTYAGHFYALTQDTYDGLRSLLADPTQ